MKTCTVSCAICCKEFSSKRRDAKYCSKECSREAEVQAMPIDTCLHCGKEFRVDKPERKYCSHECYSAASIGSTRNSKKRINKHCVVCGTVFESGGRLGDSNFCSWECRYKGRYRKGKIAKELSLSDAAYIAGFCDGEGCFMLFMRRDVVCIRISAANTNKGILEWLVDVTGTGNIVRKPSNNPKHKVSYQWLCNSESAESVLRQIRPYLRIKTRQADMLLDVQEKLKIPSLKADRAWQKEAYEQVRRMNRRGPIEAGS